MKESTNILFDDIKYDGPDKTPAEKWLPFTKKKN